MIEYRFLSPAQDEIIEASQFYENASVGLGRDFLDDVQQAIERLRKYPQSGAQVDNALRRILLQSRSLITFFADAGWFCTLRGRCRWFGGIVCRSDSDRYTPHPVRHSRSLLPAPV